jgi:hypothetical protein
LDGDIVADIGAAEGIFALSVVEKEKEIYLFECEEKWIEVLKKTFEPWQEIVRIVNKYIMDDSADKSITLDDFFLNKEINFVKADIEGYETLLLKGAKKALSNQTDICFLSSRRYRFCIRPGE